MDGLTRRDFLRSLFAAGLAAGLPLPMGVSLPYLQTFQSVNNALFDAQHSLYYWRWLLPPGLARTPNLVDTNGQSFMTGNAVSVMVSAIDSKEGRGGDTHAAARAERRAAIERQLPAVRALWEQA